MQTVQKQVILVTGAGSGVGRAVAMRFSRRGWRVVLVGRHAVTLKETASLMKAPAERCLACPCDIQDELAVCRMTTRALERFGRIDVLVNAAGTNTPDRAWEVLTPPRYREIVGTNLNGAFYCIQAILPSMRRQQSGTIVNIVSDAAKQASAKAGGAYVASKFGLLGLTQSVNAEERIRGIRACAILPGDIDTPLLDKRPTPPSVEARRVMLRSEDVARCVELAVDLPAHAVVEEILIRPR